MTSSSSSGDQLYSNVMARGLARLRTTASRSNVSSSAEARVIVPGGLCLDIESGNVDLHDFLQRQAENFTRGLEVHVHRADPEVGKIEQHADVGAPVEFGDEIDDRHRAAGNGEVLRRVLNDQRHRKSLLQSGDIRAGVIEDFLAELRADGVGQGRRVVQRAARERVGGNERQMLPDPGRAGQVDLGRDGIKRGVGGRDKACDRHARAVENDRRGVLGFESRGIVAQQLERQLDVIQQIWISLDERQYAGTLRHADERGFPGGRPADSEPLLRLRGASASSSRGCR